MALRFPCEKCGQPIISKFLKIGETAKCKNCGFESEVPSNAVSTTDVPDYTSMTPVAQRVNHEKTPPNSSFSSLRTVSAGIKVIAWISGAAYLIFGLVSVSMTRGSSGFLMLLVAVVGAAVVFVMLYAAAELILVILAIEKNTRLTREILEK